MTKKVAFVTGASSGMGEATAEIFVARGYATVLVDRDVELGRKVEATLRKTGDCTFIACDVSDDDQVRNAVEQAVKTYGRIDAVFNAAGIGGTVALTHESTMENWNRVMSIDLNGVWFCMRHQIRQMLAQGGGAIVNCASFAGLFGAPYLSAYVAAKHGVVGLTKCAAVEYARQNIRVNAICPGMIDTPMWRRGVTKENEAALLAGDVIGRLGMAQEMASLAVFLCEDGASFINGQAIGADGGMSAR